MLKFQLLDINGDLLTAYQTLYRRFFVHGVKWSFMPRYAGSDYNQALENNALGRQYGGLKNIVYISCRDNRAAPGSYEEAITTNDCKVFPISYRYKSRYERRPVFQDDADETAGTALTYRTGWVDLSTGDDTVFYTGVCWIDSEGGGTNPVTIMGTAYLTFADAKTQSS